jgi:hypothetical protein
VAQLLGNRSDAQHVDIGKIQLGLGVEIFVTQIAAADDGNTAVGQPQLVVHAPMLLRQVHQAADTAGNARFTAQVLRIEQADFDVRVRSECCNGVVQAVAGGVVQQNAHSHAAVCGLEQLIDQGARAQAVVNDVVLQIQAGFGVANQFGAGLEGIAAVGQQTETGTTVMGLRHGLNRAAESRCLRRRSLAGLILGANVGTTGHAQCNQQAKGQSP